MQTLGLVIFLAAFAVDAVLLSLDAWLIETRREDITDRAKQHPLYAVGIWALQLAGAFGVALHFFWGG
jgi:hypothetical protein